MKKLFVAVLIISFFNVTAQEDPIWNSFGDSECQENVNRFQWSDAYFDQKNATVKILFAGGGACSGTIINQYTEENELRQFLMSSEHCWDDDDPLNPITNEYGFVFNYQSPTWDNGDVPLNNLRQSTISILSASK